MSSFPLSGAGSLPFLEWEEALRFVAQYCPEMPYLPELPQANERDYLVMRPLYDLSSAQYAGSGRAELTCEPLSELMECFKSAKLSISIQDQVGSFLRFFSNALLCKLQCVGPVTFCENILWRGEAVSSNADAHAILLEFYQRWVSELLLLIEEQKQTAILFFDEPMLGIAPGSSAGRLRGEDVLRWAIARCKSTGITPAVHCCAPISQAPSVLWEAQGLSFDVTPRSLQEVAAKLGGKVRESYLLGLGLIQPGAMLTGKQCDLIVKEVSNCFQDISGVEMFLTPACGLALTTEENCIKTHESLRLLQSKLRAACGE